MEGKKRVQLKPLHAGISVRNMDEAIIWYRDILGFVLESDKYIAPLKARVVFMKLDDFYVELFEADNANPLPEERRIPNLDLRTHGNKHVAFKVNDIKIMMEEVKSKGCDVAMDIFPMEGSLVAFIRDNTGNLIELIEGHEKF